MTRAYFGEQIREGQWSRMFDRRLPSVIPMSPRLLATTDGTEMSAGRGSGLDVNPMEKDKGKSIGIFWAIFQFGSFIGAVIALAINIRSGELSAVNTSTYIVSFFVAKKH